MPVSLAPSAPVPIYSTRPSLSMNTGAYYPTVATSAQAQPQMQAQPYDPYPADVVAQAPVPNRPSSGAWTVQDDQNLLAARQQGLNWAQIQSSFFPNKSPNACRKRHERLMERKGADDWDNRKLERLAKEYMSMRKEIWQPLAARTGEKWIVVEAKVSSIIPSATSFFFFFSFSFSFSLSSSSSFFFFLLLQSPRTPFRILANGKIFRSVLVHEQRPQKLAVGGPIGRAARAAGIRPSNPWV